MQFLFSLSARAMRGSLEFLEGGKNHESVRVPSILQPLGISHCHVSSHSVSNNFGELPFKHSFQFMALTASVSGKHILDVMHWIHLSLQIWGWQFARQPQFFDRFKKCWTLLVVTLGVMIPGSLYIRAENGSLYILEFYFFPLNFIKYLVCEERIFLYFPTNYQLSNPSLSQWFMMLSLSC